MKLKKIAALGMAAVMAAGTLAGCGGERIMGIPPATEASNRKSQ